MPPFLMSYVFLCPENKFIIDGKTYILNSEPVGKHLLLDMAATLTVAKSENINIEDTDESESKVIHW